jgi:hypothetical protein
VSVSLLARWKNFDRGGNAPRHHMMNHEELDMMQAVEVYDEKNGPVGFDGGAICSPSKK